MDLKINNVLLLAQLYYEAEQREPAAYVGHESYPQPVTVADVFYRALCELHPTAAGMLRRDGDDGVSPGSIRELLRWMWDHPQVMG